MTKVSKATATRDLADLAAIGAIVPVGAGPVARYAINGAFSREPIEPLNEPLNQNLLKLIRTHPGVKIPYLHSVVSASRATVKRMIAELIAEGKIAVSSDSSRWRSSLNRCLSSAEKQLKNRRCSRFR